MKSGCKWCKGGDDPLGVGRGFQGALMIEGCGIEDCAVENRFIKVQTYMNEYQVSHAVFNTTLYLCLYCYSLPLRHVQPCLHHVPTSQTS